MSVLFLSLLILNSHATLSSTIPLHTRGADIPEEELVHGYVDDPKGRGTVGIIVSCLVTLALCVCSALQLNVPMKSETRTQRYLRYTKWILLGTFIPELVVLSAWKQWLSAKSMSSQMKKIFDEELAQQKEGGSEVDISSVNTLLLLKLQQANNLQGYTTDKAVAAATGKTRWTFVHSMYAGMGGFAFDMDLLPQGDGAFIPNRDRLTLTAPGVLLLARCGLLPVISLPHLDDKSKRDGIERFIVCVQASWMIVQTISRAFSHQTITLLEFNTLGHVFTALVIYILWWNKPSNVKHPTFVQGDGMEALCAYFYMSSRLSGRKALTRVKLRAWRKPELAGFAWYDSKPTSPTDPETPPQAVPQLLLSPSVFAPGWSWFENAKSPRTPGEPDKKSIVDEIMGRLRARPEPSTQPKGKASTVVKRLATFETVAATDDTAAKLQTRIELASYAIRTFPAIAERFTPRTAINSTPSSSSSDTTTRTTTQWSEPILEQLVLTALGDWPSDHFLPSINHKLMGMAMWFASMGYGAVHAAAWHDFFPTRIEKILWRFSSVYICCSGALWAFLCLMALRYHWARAYWDRFKYLQATWVEYGLIGGCMLACGLAYIFARLFLVVDGLVSLRVLPKDAFDVPAWTTVIPHL